VTVEDEMMIELPETAIPTMKVLVSQRPGLERAAERGGAGEATGAVTGTVDLAAFGALVEEHQDLLVNYLSKLTGQRERAEDLAQETFVRLYQNWGRYREEGTVVAYLLRIGTNLVRDEERRKKRWNLLWPVWSRGGKSPDGVHTEELPAEPDPERRLLSAEERQRVQEALASLDLLHRTPLVLREIEGLSYQEIATILDCQEGTVKSRLHRGRQVLKEKLAPFWSADGGTS
jgi:RNA polymerase sigma-70 factor (ECF subfamily)